MPIDIERIGKQIAISRKLKGLAQNDLGERLRVSFQAVSKWEHGETLPDTGILIDLAHVLGTTVDNILNGGQRVMDYRGKIAVSDMQEGIDCLERAGRLLGRDNIIYRCTVDGISGHMNTDIEACFEDDFLRECLVAEAIIQNLKAGAYIDITDVRNNMKHAHFKEIVCRYAAKHGIV